MKRFQMSSGWVCAALIAAATLISSTASAQSNIIGVAVAGSAEETSLELFAEDVHDNIADAVADAKSRAASSGQQHEVWIAPNGTTPWVTSVTITQDDNISLRGFPPDKPYDVILDGNGAVAIELDNAGSATEIDGLTIVNSSTAILCVNGTSSTISRCLIQGNGVGVSVENDSDVLLINNSIVDSSTIGVSLEDNSAARVYFCTVYANGDTGILVQGNAAATVNSTIVFGNGLASAVATAGGIIDVSTAVSTASTVNITGNLPVDTAGVTVSGNLTGTPPFLPTGTALWKGQLDDTVADADCLDTGDQALVDALNLAKVDLELESRPKDFVETPTNIKTTAPDIGADELGDESGAVPRWYYCKVTPSPVGEIAAGDMTVEIRVSPASKAAEITEVFVLPQGMEVNGGVVPADRIRIVERTVAGGVWIGRNADPIQTVLVDNTPMVAGPGIGDVIADGHAAVYIVHSNTTILGDNYTGDFSETDATLGAFIRGQALVGRHFLIDTLAPRMDITDPTGAGADDLVTLFSVGPFGSQGAFANGFIHPYSGLPTNYRPETAPFGVDDGLITDTPTLLGNGAQAFFNTGSISNNYPRPQPLDIGINVRFEDFPPEDANGVPIPGADAFLTDGNRLIRGVAGFPDTLTDGSGTVDEVLLNGNVVRWLFDEGQSTLAGVTVQDSYADPNIPNPGFNYNSPSSTSTSPENKAVQVAWRFFADTGLTIPGIPYANGLNFSPFHFSVRFYGKEATQANDAPPPDPRTLLDPLHIWWLLSTDTLISPPREGQETAQPLYTWQLDRAFNTRSAGQLKPLYAFRIWQSTVAGNSSAAYNAIYAPVTTWSAWTEAAILTPTYFENLLNSSAILPDRWLLIAVAGADEAGNVESFPTPQALANGTVLAQELELDNVGTQNIINFLAPSGRSWQRFFYPGPGSQLETTAIGNYWHDRYPGNVFIDADEISFGSAAIVPMPTNLDTFRVSGRFRVTMSTSNPDDLVFAVAEWRLTGSDGTDLSGSVAGNGASVVEIAIPGPLGDFTNTPAQPVSYVFTARTLVNTVVDATPATVTFVVVPRSVGAFVDPKDSPDDQPVKVQESL